MRSTLRTVNHDQRTRLPPHNFHDFAHRIDGAERVRYVAERDDARAISQERSQSVEIDSAVTGQLTDAEARALLDRQLLPRDEIRVMLESRDHDVVAGPDVRTPPRRRDEIDRLGCPAGKDQAISVRDAE